MAGEGRRVGYIVRLPVMTEEKKAKMNRAVKHPLSAAGFGGAVSGILISMLMSSSFTCEIKGGIHENSVTNVEKGNTETR